MRTHEWSVGVAEAELTTSDAPHIHSNAYSRTREAIFVTVAKEGVLLWRGVVWYGGDEDEDEEEEEEEEVRGLARSLAGVVNLLLDLSPGICMSPWMKIFVIPTR